MHLRSADILNIINMLFYQIPHTNQLITYVIKLNINLAKLDKHEIVLCINLDLTISNQKKTKREIINQQFLFISLKKNLSCFTKNITKIDIRNAT